jgi:hypothetical protein
MKAIRGIRLAAATALLATFAFVLALAQEQDVRVVSSSGLTRVTWQGQEVFSGPTTGPVTALAINTNGTPRAAAFDGDKVLWESAPGAAALVKPAAGALTNRPGRWPKLPALTGGSPPLPPPGTGGSSLLVTTTNGVTVVRYKGQTVFQGPTQGGVTARSKSVNGEEWAAAFDGDQVLWENIAGAANKLK